MVNNVLVHYYKDFAKLNGFLGLKNFLVPKI